MNYLSEVRLREQRQRAVLLALPARRVSLVEALRQNIRSLNRRLRGAVVTRSVRLEAISEGYQRAARSRAQQLIAGER